MNLMAQDKPGIKSEIAGRVRILNMILLVPVLVLSLLVSAMIIMRTGDKASENIARSYSIAVAEKFFSVICQDIGLVQKASVSKALTEWFVDEGNPGKKALAFYEMQDYAGLRDDAHFFAGIQSSLNEYSIKKETTAVQFVPFDKLQKSNPDDAWYFNSIASDKDYLLNMDVDKITQTWKLWINHKVIVDGNVVGVFCSGLDIQHALAGIFGRYDSKYVRGYIVDRSGAIQMPDIFSDFYEDEYEIDIHELWTDTTIISALDSYDENAHDHFNFNTQSHVDKLKNSPYGYAAIEPIAGSDWFVVILFNANPFSALRNSFVLPVFLIITFALYLLANNFLMGRMVFRPLYSLTQSVSNTSPENVEIYGNGRNDEIGDLAQMIRKMADKFNKQTLNIRESHERARLLLDAMPLCCSLWDREIKPFDCNDEAVNLFGLKDKQEYLARFFDMSPEYQPDGELSREKLARYVNKAFDEKVCAFEWEHCLLDGTSVPSEVTLVRIRYGVDYAVASYTRDMREQKQMLMEIGRRDDLLDTVNLMAAIFLQLEVDKFESGLQRCMGMIAAVVNADRVYIWKNHNIDDVLYCTQLYEWPGKPETQQDGTIPSILYSETIPHWEETLSRGYCINGRVRDMSTEERIYLSPQGVLSILVVPVFIQNHFWGFVGFEDCHSEREFSENEEVILRSASLLIANALLRNEMALSIRSSSIKLEAALEEANSANRAKSSFLAKVSHEMRTPLNAIIGLSELSIGEKVPPEERHSNIKKVHSAGVTLLDTVNDILDITKIESGKFKLVPAEYETASLINDAITQSILRKKDKPIEFVLDINEDLPQRLFGDELRIKQILNNLLSNAFKYTKEGKVTLGITCTRDTSSMDDESVWLEAVVSDTGVGIRPESIDSLFTDYIQLDPIASRKVESTGLGLSIAKRMAEMMDGSITVESEFDKGSVFTVRLRQKFVSDQVIGADIAERLKTFRYFNSKPRWVKPKYISLPNVRVLVVDDIIPNLDVAEGMLKLYDIQVDCVTSGQEAVDAIYEEKVHYDAVFMDHMMPGMDGIEAARIIREEIATDYARNIPLIALTANAIVGNEEMFLSKGFQAFVPKPVEAARLDVVVKKWLCSGEQGGDSETDRSETPDAAARNDFLYAALMSEEIKDIDFRSGLERFGGNVDPFINVLKSYCANTRPLLEQIKEVDDKNLIAYSIIVHGIKSSSRGICAGNVGNQAEALELAVGKGDIDFVKSNNPALITNVENLIINIEEMLGRIREKIAKPKKERPDDKSLTELLTACEKYNMDEVDAAMAKIEAFEYESDEGLTVWLRENIDQTNFTQIKEKLSVLLGIQGGQNG